MLRQILALSVFFLLLSRGYTAPIPRREKAAAEEEEGGQEEIVKEEDGTDDARPEEEEDGTDAGPEEEEEGTDAGPDEDEENKDEYPEEDEDEKDVKNPAPPKRIRSRGWIAKSVTWMTKWLIIGIVVLLVVACVGLWCAYKFLLRHGDQVKQLASFM